MEIGHWELSQIYGISRPSLKLFTVAKKEPLPDVSQWVTAAQKGDTQAFGKVYDALVRPVYRYIYYRVEPMIAEDLTEEVFFKAWQNLKKYKKTKVPFSAWIFKIAHNLICDYYRKHKPILEIDENMADERSEKDFGQKVDLKLTQIHLHSAIKKLPQSYQQVVVLKYINEMENTEIALTLGKSEGAVRTLQSRALKQLKGILDNND